MYLCNISNNGRFPHVCVAGLGDYEPSGVCCARVSPDERVGGDLGECSLPCVQLLPQVRAFPPTPCALTLADIANVYPHAKGISNGSICLTVSLP